MADGQPQPRALARRLGGEKRVEDLAQVVCRDAAARVADDDVHGIIRAQAGGDGDHPVLADGLGGIGEKIEDHLAQLRRVAVDRRQGLVIMAHDGDIIVLGFLFHQHGHVFNDPVDLHGLNHRVPFPGKIQQIPGDFRAAVHLLHNLLDRPLKFLGGLPVAAAEFLQQMLHPLGLLADDGQGIVDFMGDAGRKFTDGGQFLRLQQPFIQQPIFFSGPSIRVTHLRRPDSPAGKTSQG